MSVRTTWPKIGAKYGRLTILKNGYRTGVANIPACKVRCDCGVVRLAPSGQVMRGGMTSCGCKRLEGRKPDHGLSFTPTYRSWSNALDRCRNKKNSKYKYYGGRGIKMCRRWWKFANFLADMGVRPLGKISLDRIDNDGNYEPGNCRWATKKEQARNCRSNIHYTLNGVSKPLSAWTEEYGVRYKLAHARIKRGLSLKAVLGIVLD